MSQPLTFARASPTDYFADWVVLVRMTPTTCHMTISLDGFVAGPDQSRDNPLGVGGLELPINAGTWTSPSTKPTPARATKS